MFFDAAWSSLSRTRRDTAIAIAFDPANTSTVYATYAGFGGAHVWRSTDSGDTWTSIDNGLPDMPVHALVVDPTRAGRIFREGTFKT